MRVFSTRKIRALLKVNSGDLIKKCFILVFDSFSLSA
jgi:hypothetical protein